MTISELRGCDIDGCPRKHASKGLCATHYKAHQRARGMERISTRTCNEPGCGKPHSAKGLCKSHYATGRQTEGICAVGDCQRISRNGQYCDSHRRRAKGGRLDVRIRVPGQVECLFPDCNGGHFRAGVCRRHYRGGRVDKSVAGQDFRGPQLLWKYRVSLQERGALFASQGDLCALCRDAEPSDIDHDHAHQCADPRRAEDDKRGCRECVRGGLCSRCNTTLAIYEGGYGQIAATELLNSPAWRAMADIYLVAPRPFAGTPDPITGEVAA